MTAVEGPGSRERAWLLVCSSAIVGFAVLTGVAVVQAGDAFAIGFTIVLIAAAVAVACGRLRLRHLPWVWLVANAYGAALWKDLSELPDPVIHTTTVLWVLAALALLVVVVVASASRAASVIGALAVFTGAASHSLGPHVSAYMWVWRHEASLLAQANAEIARETAMWSNAKGKRRVKLVHPRGPWTDASATRVTFHWFDSLDRVDSAGTQHYTVRYIIYDPTGDPTPVVVDGSSASHLFGPWYLSERR